MADTLPPGDDNYVDRGRSSRVDRPRSSRFDDWDDYEDSYRSRDHGSPRRRSRSRERRRDYDDEFEYETIEYDHRARVERDFYRERDRERSSSYRSREKTRRDYDHYDRLRGDNRRRDDRYSRSQDSDRRYRDSYDDHGDYGYSNERQETPPSNILVLKGLPMTVVEEDIHSLVRKELLECKDIRIIRDRNGDSKGFAFVEFAELISAEQWMAIVQGNVTIDKKYVTVEYSRQRPAPPPGPPLNDWNCAKCDTLNYASRRRNNCFSCGTIKEDDEAEESVRPSERRGRDKEPIAAPPCNVVILRGLDTKTSEEAVRNAIVLLTTCPIYDVRLIKDKITGMSRGFCFIEMGSVEDATKLIETIQASDPVYEIDSREVFVGYARNSPNPPGKSKQSLVDTSGNSTATTALSSAKSSSSLASVAIAQAQAAQRHGSQAVAPAPYNAQQYTQSAPVATATQSSDPNGMLTFTQDAYGQRHYAHQDGTEQHTANAMPAGGTTGMVYDPASGYYYDANSGLHYDANTGYYYHAAIGKFLVWEPNSQCYYEVNQDGTMGAIVDVASNAASTVAPAGTAAIGVVAVATSAAAESEKDKVKNKPTAGSTGAKKIAKDMQRWAKQMNRMSAAKQTVVKQLQLDIELQEAKEEALREKIKEHTPDVFKKPMAFALPSKADPPAVKSLFTSDVDDDSPLVGLSPAASNKRKPAASLVAEYGDNDSDDELEKEKDKFTDWKLLACLLCQRQFPSKDVLVKHQQLSDLHKQNLEQYRKKLISEVQQINAQIRGGR